MSPTVILTGLLPFVLLSAAVLALPVSLLLLRQYRQAVRRGMARSGGASRAEGSVPPPPPPGHVPASRLTLRKLGLTGAANGREQVSSTLRSATRGPWRAARVYGAAGAFYAFFMTIGWLVATHDTNVSLTKVLLLFWIYFWPAIICIALVAAYDRTRRVRLFGIYALVFLAIVGIALSRSPDLTPGALPLLWILQNGPPTLLVLLCLFRPIRAVGPLVLAFLIALGIGSQFILLGAAESERLLHAIASVGFGLGLGARGVFAAMILAGVLLFTPLGWIALRWLGRRYERRKVSDQIVMLDAFWLIFGMAQSIGLVFEGLPWILTGVVAFAGYASISRIGFRRMRDRGEPIEPITLLQLRVFALGKRSEQLFDKLRTHWLYTGSISLIAGPDLVTSTIEPHEFLDFVRGRIGRQFVMGADDLARRMMLMERSADPDGRYRINEFFCQSDTWKMTMEQLAATSDAVIMDVRGFSSMNAGCIFELGRLLDGVDLERVVLLVDDTTDQAFLETTLHDLWRNLSVESPNRLAVAPTVRLFRIVSQSERELNALLTLLMPGARAPAAVSV
jgi:hypothetical protein